MSEGEGSIGSGRYSIGRSEFADDDDATSLREVQTESVAIVVPNVHQYSLAKTKAAGVDPSFAGRNTPSLEILGSLCPIQHGPFLPLRALEES